MRNAIAGIVLCLGVGAALAADPPAGERVEHEAGGDRFSAGGSVSITRPVPGDVFGAGGSVEVDTRVGGDVVAVGGNVRLKGEVDSSVLAGGGQVIVNARVKRNVRVAGGQVEIGPRGEVGGNLSVAGGQVRIEGPVFGYVQMAGGNLTLDGTVGGDVWVTGGRLVLGPNARVAGKLRYALDSEPERDPAALVKGGLERMELERPFARKHDNGAAPSKAGWVWSLGLMVAAAAWVLLAPSLSARASDRLRAQPGVALLVGFVVLVCVPVGAVLLVLTVIGLPIAAALLLFYPALLLVGYLSTGVSIGDWTLQRFAAAGTVTRFKRAAAAAAAMLVVALLARLPVAGGLIAFVAVLLGLGALTLQWRRPGGAAAA